MPSELISDLELTGIREDVNQLFVDEGTIHRITAEGTFDPDAESITPDTTVPIYSGVASIYPISARRDRFDEHGQGLIFIRQYRIVLPYTADDIQIRDIWTATVSDDPQLIGREMEVRDVFVSTITGYRRLTAHDTEE